MGIRHFTIKNASPDLDHTMGIWMLVAGQCGLQK